MPAVEESRQQTEDVIWGKTVGESEEEIFLKKEGDRYFSGVTGSGW